MNMLQAISNVSSGAFIQYIELTKEKQVSRAERKRKERIKREKQIDDAVASTGLHHREALYKKWGWN